jgi:hypothetical protein
MPGKYYVTLTVTDLYDNEVSADDFVYVYDWDYLGGLNVSKTNTCLRFAIPQQSAQGVGWSEYNGVINEVDEGGWPYPSGIAGTCQVIDSSENRRQLVMDSNTWRRYELGRRNQWLDGEDSYGGSEVESEILLREHTPPVGATAKLKHGQSHGRLKPWDKETRNTTRYDEHGFPRTLERDVFYRTDSGIIDNAVVKNVPRKAQIVSDRHIESEFVQVGYRFRGAPWRLTQTQQWYRQLDTAGAPPIKVMSEYEWGEEWLSRALWMARAVTAGTNYVTGEAFGGSIAGQVAGPDGITGSAVNFGATGSYWADIANQAGDFTLSMWVMGPVTSTLNLFRIATGGLIVTLDADSVEFDDGVNNVECTVAPTEWTMITLVRSGSNLIVYANGSVANTYALTDPTIVYGGRATIGGAGVVGYDAQILTRAVSADAIEYAYNDVIENEGNSVGWPM